MNFTGYRVTDMATDSTSWLGYYNYQCQCTPRTPAPDSVTITGHQSLGPRPVHRIVACMRKVKAL